MDASEFRATENRLFNEAVCSGFELAVRLLGTLGMLGATFGEEELWRFVEEVARKRRHPHTGQPVTTAFGLPQVGIQGGEVTAVAGWVVKGRNPDFDAFVE